MKNMNYQENIENIIKLINIPSYDLNKININYLYDSTNNYYILEFSYENKIKFRCFYEIVGFYINDKFLFGFDNPFIEKDVVTIIKNIVKEKKIKVDNNILDNITKLLLKEKYKGIIENHYKINNVIKKEYILIKDFIQIYN